MSRPISASARITRARDPEHDGHGAGESFAVERMYSEIGRPSIPPEQLLRALLLQSLYTIRSERLLMEEIDYSILFRWFIGLSMDEEIWSPTTFK